MARLLTEEDHEALLADRARLEWLLMRHTLHYAVGLLYTPGLVIIMITMDDEPIAEFGAPTWREAIDMARAKYPHRPSGRSNHGSA